MVTDSGGSWPRRERRLYLTMVLLAAVASFWVQLGVFDLRRASVRRDQQLTEFELLCDQAKMVPDVHTGARAADFRQRLAAQDWYAGLSAARPRLVSTPLGLSVRLVTDPMPTASREQPR